MCNVDDDGLKGPLPSTGQSISGSNCVKCGARGVLITRIHDAFCKDCFQVYVVHKFRSAIGKSKLIRDGEKVLVAFSGGINSAALLHLIQDGLSHRAHKRLRFTPTLLHVDESSLIKWNVTESQEKQDQVKALMVGSGFPSYWTQLEQALEACRDTNDCSESRVVSIDERLHLTCLDGENGTSSPVSSQELKDKLLNFIQSVGNVSAQEDCIHNLRRQLLVMAAKQLGFCKILTAETSSRLAVRILSDVAQGRGAQVSFDTGISDERNNVMFMRPVRDLNAKELALYNSLFEVQSVFMPCLTTKTGLASSIERLTQTFVTSLQADFPSTVSNIVRTSEKLGLPDTKGSEKCSFCQSPLDTNVGKASALGAVLFSEKMSRKSKPSSPPSPEGAVNNLSQTSESLDAIKVTLCYGCRLSLSTFDGHSKDLPQMVTESAAQIVRTKQKEQLYGFLLEDESGDDDEHSGSIGKR